MPVSGLRTKEDFEQRFVPDEMDTFGDRWGHRWRGSQKLQRKLYLDILKEVIGHDRKLTVLDIGCGQSDVLLKFYEMFPDFEYHGMDISENVITWNKKNYPFIHYKQQALPEVGYPPDTFDLICVLEVLYYLKEAQQKAALSNLAEALKPGGMLLLSGLLDHKHFIENRILQVVKQILSIRCIEYNYARLYKVLEVPLFKGFRGLRQIHEILTLSEVDFERWVSGTQKGLIRIGRFVRCNGVRQIVKLGTHVLSWLLVKILGWEWLPRVCFAITRGIMGDKGRTHLILLVYKPAHFSGL